MVGKKIPEKTKASELFTLYLGNGERVYRMQIWKQFFDVDLFQKFAIGNVRF